jgi:protein phosphatase
MEQLAKVCKASDGLSLATAYKQVDVSDTASVEVATRWWEELTGCGGEGMVLKPFEFIVRGRRDTSLKQELVPVLRELSSRCEDIVQPG